MKHLHTDCETYSECDLRKEGVHNYARHPSTELLCVAYVLAEEDDLHAPIQLWWPGDPVPPEVIQHIEGGGLVYGHNVTFERLLIGGPAGARWGWPTIEIEQTRCTMAMAHAMCLPGSLENAASALGMDLRKDMHGRSVMLKLCKPTAVRKDGTVERITRDDDAQMFWHLGEYCKNDVAVERGMTERLLDLGPKEWAVYHLDQEINDRGMGIDVPACHAAIKVMQMEKARLDERMAGVTNGAVTACSQAAALTKWVAERTGATVAGVAKADVLDYLEDPDLPADVRQALLLRQEGAKSSTAKVTAMLDRVSPWDSRARGTMQYWGAGTGRWAGRAIQPQNFPRPDIGRGLSREDCADEIDMLVKQTTTSWIGDAELFYGSALGVLSDSLRGLIQAAPGHVLVPIDFSSIEARVLAWLAGQEDVLDAFRDGTDVYKLAATRIFGVSYDKVTKSQRQIGKVAVLALGYQGGVHAFQSMARNYNVKVKDAEADEIKKAWRDSHKDIVRYWHDLEAAAVQAVRNPGEVRYAGAEGRTVKFKQPGSWLLCQLPSGRVLTYPYPEIIQKETPWSTIQDAVQCKSWDHELRRFEFRSLYGGLLSENITQAVSRDLLVEAMAGLKLHGYPIAFHVHDEVVVECQPYTGLVETLEKIVTRVPSWAQGLPIEAEAWSSTRYGK